MPDKRLQAQLSTLLHDVHALSREIQRTAVMQSGRGAAAYSVRLGELFDKAITQSSGRDQIICLAAAAEHGVLQWHHLSRGARTAGETPDRALRALYWATAGRWQRAHASGAALFHPKPPRTSPVSLTLCGHCQELQKDCRRFAPHAAMRDLRDRTGACVDDGMRCWFHCGSCDVLWVRRLPAHEPFATWSVVRAGTM